jgi:hypothetical protein
MLIKQISVFVQNEMGRLADITRTLKDYDIDIRSLSVADTADFGILRLIVNKPDRAYAALKGAGCTVSMTDVLGVEVSDKPGGLAYLVRVLADGGISIEYIYAFIARSSESAYVILKASDAEEAQELLCKHSIKTLTEQEVYGL